MISPASPPVLGASWTTTARPVFLNESPMDREAIVESFEKTGRAVVVHEAPRTGGLAGEITALLQEEALFYQEAPIERVTGWDVPYPLYELEDFQLPNAARVAEAIEDVAST